MKDLSRRTGGNAFRSEVYQSLEKKNLNTASINQALNNLSDQGYIIEEDNYYKILNN